MTENEIDPRLDEVLVVLGDEFGPLDVALAAAQRTDKNVLIQQLTTSAGEPPEPTEEPEPAMIEIKESDAELLFKAMAQLALAPAERTHLAQHATYAANRFEDLRYAWELNNAQRADAYERWIKVAALLDLEPWGTPLKTVSSFRKLTPTDRYHPEGYDPLEAARVCNCGWSTEQHDPAEHEPAKCEECETDDGV